MIDRNLYRQPAALDRNLHRALRSTRAFGDLAAAASANSLFVAAVEFADASREYPLVFIAAGDDEQAPGKTHVAPMAALGLARGENLYWDGTRWDARYVPACLRRYPFAMAQAGPEQLAMVIDRDWAGFSEADGDPLFDAAGEPVPKLVEMRDFCERFETEVQRTRVACARLRDEGLLHDRRFDATLPDGGKLAFDGFMTVDEAKLAALPDAKLVELQRVGLLVLIHLHLASLPLMRRLVERRLARAGAASA